MGKCVYFVRLLPPGYETDIVATVKQLLWDGWSSGACIQILSPCFGLHPAS